MYLRSFKGFTRSILAENNPRRPRSPRSTPQKSCPGSQTCRRLSTCPRTYPCAEAVTFVSLRPKLQATSPAARDHEHLNVVSNPNLFRKSTTHDHIPAPTVYGVASTLVRLYKRSTRQVQHLRNCRQFCSNLPIFRFRNGFTTFYSPFMKTDIWTYTHSPWA